MTLIQKVGQYRPPCRQRNMANAGFGTFGEFSRSSQAVVGGFRVQPHSEANKSPISDVMSAGELLAPHFPPPTPQHLALQTFLLFSASSEQRARVAEPPSLSSREADEFDLLFFLPFALFNTPLSPHSRRGTSPFPPLFSSRSPPQSCPMTPRRDCKLFHSR